MWGRFGRTDGVPFDAEALLQFHPQWKWKQGYLASRASQPWTYFDGNDEIAVEELRVAA